MVDFEDNDGEEDPTGMGKLKQINFNLAGIKCGNKNYSSPSSAKVALTASKKRISDLMNEARLSQVHSFKQSIGSLVAHDTAVMNMPRIRITAQRITRSNAGPSCPQAAKRPATV